MAAASSAVPVQLSIAERDRRCAAIAERMARARIDILVLPASTARWEQTMADSRYFTSIGGFGTEALTLFSPRHGTTCYVFNRASYWKSAQSWVSDVRDGRNRWAENIAERLGEIGFTKGRIGVSGLEGLTRTPDGIVPHHTIQEIARLFPAAEIVDATRLMSELRAVKSEEEIAMAERATLIAEAMAATVEALRPGDTERTVYAEMTRTLLVEGGELPAMLLLGTGPGLEHGNFVPGLRKLEKGDFVVGEIEGRYAGYSGQIVRPAVLGRAAADYREVFDITLRCFEDVLGALKAGATLASVLAAFEAAVARHGKGSCEGHFPLMHARGLGDDLPVMLSAADAKDNGTARLEAGMVFVLKPRVRRRGVPAAQIGDTVVVGRDGGRRLGRAPLRLIEVPWNA
jgi:Xaa-Pro aminopeptidase